MACEKQMRTCMRARAPPTFIPMASTTNFWRGAMLVLGVITGIILSAIPPILYYVAYVGFVVPDVVPVENITVVNTTAPTPTSTRNFENNYIGTYEFINVNVLLFSGLLVLIMGLVSLCFTYCYKTAGVKGGSASWSFWDCISSTLLIHGFIAGCVGFIFGVLYLIEGGAYTESELDWARAFGIMRIIFGVVQVLGALFGWYVLSMTYQMKNIRFFSSEAAPPVYPAGYGMVPSTDAPAVESTPAPTLQTSRQRMQSLARTTQSGGNVYVSTLFDGGA